MQGKEIDEYIKRKYERTDEKDPLEVNQGAIAKLIDLLHLHENCSDVRFQNIAKNIQNLEKLVPNFAIFETQKYDSSYLINFGAYTLSQKSNSLVDAHEFGHMVVHGINGFELREEEYTGVIQRAKAHCISDEKKAEFREYMDYLTNRENGERTEAEKGPLADILSSVFQYPSLAFVNPDGTNSRVMVFPSSHSREYYFDVNNGKMKANIIFDEDFANYYALALNGCTRELGILRNFLGDEWMQTMENELDKASRIIQEPNIDKASTIDAKLSSALLTAREGELPKELPSIERVGQIENEREER